MKYLNIQGFKAEEASGFLSTDRPPRGPAVAPVSGPQPASHVGHKPSVHLSAVRTTPGEGGGDSQMKSLPSPWTCTFSLSVRPRAPRRGAER